MPAPKILLLTTKNDVSIGLFSKPECAGKIQATSIFYDQPVPGDFDFVYLRDPFTDASFSWQIITKAVNKAYQLNKQAYFVDAIKKYDDLMLEDKWRQYNLFTGLMPDTRVYKGVMPAGTLVKKRISSRSRHIFFKPNKRLAQLNANDFIVQQKLTIIRELRAFMVGGQLITPLAIKTSRTPKSHVRMIGLEPNAPKQVREICRNVQAKVNLDFVGLDIVQTDKGYYLLEVNRSPLFSGFFRLSKINLASRLYDHLLAKTNMLEN